MCYKVIGSSPAGLVARDHYYLADIAQNENDLPGAETELRSVLITEPGYVPARLALASSLFKSGDEDGAQKEYLAVLKIEANQPQASLGIARIELQRGNDDAAVARLDELLAVHPESTAAAALFAQVLERLGQKDRAVAVAQWSLQKPESPLADPWMAELLSDCYDIQRLSITFEEYFKTGKMTEAVPLLDRLSELDPNSPITKIFSGFSHAKALHHITAVREYYEALGKGGDPEKICPYLVQSLLALGKISEADSLMADYYNRMPESIPIAKAYSEVVLRAGNNELARKLLTKILEKEPYLQPQNMSLAKILWDSGERDAAAKCLQRVAAVYVSDVPSHALLGEYYLGKSNPAAAIKFLQEAYSHAAEKTPAQASLAAMLGTAYLQIGNEQTGRGNLQEALKSYEQAIRFAPADLDGYAGKANVCVQLKQFRGAAGALEKLVALDPKNPTILLSLGDVLYQDGKEAEARRRWGRARELVAVGDDELKAALDRRLNGPITPDIFQ